MSEHEFVVTEGRVAVKVAGQEVSGLGLGRRDFQVGPGTYLSMGTIGGVSTRPEYRSRGLSSAVMARTIEEMKARRLATSGLYTGTRIVAHRLYRRFGFVDIFIPHMRTLILEPRDYLRREARRWLTRAQVTAEGARRVARLRATVVFDLTDSGPLTLRLRAGEVSVRRGRSRRADLTLTLDQAALVSIFQRTAGTEELRRLGRLQVVGSRALWRRLQETLLPRWETPIEQE